MSSFTDNLLPIYIVGETIRANYAYFAFQAAPQITPSLIALLSETLKLAISAIIINQSEEGLASIRKKLNRNSFKDVLPYGVPAAFYLTNNLIYFTALPSTSPSLLQRVSHQNWILLGVATMALSLGVFFSIVSYPVATRMTTDRGTNSTLSVTSTVTIAIYFSCLTSGVGLIVAAMLRKKDNLTKLVGTSISLLTIAATQYVIFPALRSSGFTAWKVIGGLVVIVSTGCYNYFKDTSPESAVLFSQLLPTSNEYNQDGEISELEKPATSLALEKLLSWLPSIRPKPSSTSYGLIEIRDMEAEDSPPSTNKDQS